jgi:hypothetical protein
MKSTFKDKTYDVPCSGFTLLETLIYSGLFGVMIIGALGFVGPLMISMATHTARIMHDADVLFVTHVIDSYLEEASVIEVPHEGEASNTLRFTTWSGRTYTFESENNTLMMSTSGTPVPLTNSRTRVLSATFTHTAPKEWPRVLSYTIDTQFAEVGPKRTYLPW